MPTTSQRAVLAACFAVGAAAVCAQAVLLRETQVLLFGSELSWGLVLAFWLAGVAAGAALGGRLCRRTTRPGIVFAASAIALPAALVVEIALLRVARTWLGVGPGEYIGPTDILWLAAAAAVPVSLWVGLAFPAAAALAGRTMESQRRASQANVDPAGGIGWLYMAESAGSLVGGALFSFALVDGVAAIPLAMGAGVLLALVAALVLGRCEGSRRGAAVALVAALVPAVLIGSGLAGRLDNATILRRWQSFAGGLELVRSLDTRYQNVAIGRLDSQYSLYASGLVSATWPDPAESAALAHLAACEAPRTDRILLLGGGAEGLVQELVRHGPSRLDFVTLDERALEAVRPLLTEADRAALAAPACRVHFADARRFVRRARADGLRYDLILLAAPEPASTLDARLYTEEAFGDLAGLLAERGVLHFSLSVPVGYWSRESAAYVGAVLGALERAMPETLITFGDPMHVFAAREPGVLTDSPQVLAARYRERGVLSPAFDPLWFLGTSEQFDAEKRGRIRASLAAQPPRFLNTDSRPIAAIYHMWTWLRTTAAAHANEHSPAEQRTDVLGAMLAMPMDRVLWAVLAATALAAGLGIVRGRAAIARTALVWSVGTTGMAAMAIEVVLLHTFQTLYGYVYGMVGLVVGVFMFGLVLGSLAMNRRLRRAAARDAAGPGLKSLVGLDLAVAVFAAGLVFVPAGLRAWGADWAVQAVTFGLVAAAGVLAGLVFPLAAAVALKRQGDVVRAAAAVDAADHVGACLGALVTGTLLVPVLGISGSCLTVAAVKVLSALVVGAATVRRTASP